MRNEVEYIETNINTTEFYKMCKEYFKVFYNDSLHHSSYDTFIINDTCLSFPMICCYDNYINKEYLIPYDFLYASEDERKNIINAEIYRNALIENEEFNIKNAELLKKKQEEFDKLKQELGL